MGNLLKILRKDEGQKDGHDIFVNFESISRTDAEPTDAENEVFNTVKKVLEKSVIILKNIQEYNSASDSIRQAISNPKSDELQDIAWEAVVPLVEKLKKFYEFSQELDKTAKDLLEKLCSTDMTPEQHLEEQQALFKQFADILDFVLRFDDLKMTNPSIQNDFSYYRRTLSRMKLANEEDSKEYIVTNEEANRLALFYAVATPMLNMLSTAVTEFVSQRKDIPVEYTTECLHTMAKICKVMVETPEFVSRFTTSETKFFCLRVMVGVIILYDHVHPVGAFAKSSPIDMKGSIKVLKEQEAPRVEGLLNALRYTTKHLNDESTPKTIKVLLA